MLLTDMVVCQAMRPSFLLDHMRRCKCYDEDLSYSWAPIDRHLGKLPRQHFVWLLQLLDLLIECIDLVLVLAETFRRKRSEEIALLTNVDEGRGHVSSYRRRLTLTILSQSTKPVIKEALQDILYRVYYWNIDWANMLHLSSDRPMPLSFGRRFSNSISAWTVFYDGGSQTRCNMTTCLLRVNMSVHDELSRLRPPIRGRRLTWAWLLVVGQILLRRHYDNFFIADSAALFQLETAALAIRSLSQSVIGINLYLQVRLNGLVPVSKPSTNNQLLLIATFEHWLPQYSPSLKVLACVKPVMQLLRSSNGPLVTVTILLQSARLFFSCHRETYSVPAVVRLSIGQCHRRMPCEVTISVNTSKGDLV